MATSQDFVNWVCGPELDAWYLAYALIASRDYLKQLASGAIHKTIYMPAVESFAICVPANMEEQHRIVRSLTKGRKAIEEARTMAKAQLDDLGTLETTVLRAAFSGVL